MGDTQKFNQAVQNQLAADLKEARIEYLEAVEVEQRVKQKCQRRIALRTIDAASHTAADKALMKKSAAQWKKRHKEKIAARKQARKDYDDAHKALDSFREEEQRGHVRDYDIQKIGSQYRTKWTHLPE